MRRFAVFASVLALIALLASPVMAQDAVVEVSVQESSLMSFRNHVDVLQPVQSGRDTMLLAIGYHFTAFQVGRVSFGGLGAAVGWKSDTTNQANDGRACLLLKVPLANVRIAGQYDDTAQDNPPVLEFGSGVVYNATLDEWGASLLFSLGW